jgi:hypothetical protein
MSGLPFGGAAKPFERNCCILKGVRSRPLRPLPGDVKAELRPARRQAGLDKTRSQGCSFFDSTNNSNGRCGDRRRRLLTDIPMLEGFFEQNQFGLYPDGLGTPVAM